MENKGIAEPSWLTLPRGDFAPHWSGLYVTLNKKGTFAMSATTHARLGSPEAFRIKMDVMNERLALEPAKLEDANAYPARVQGRRGAKVVRAVRLLTEWGIRPADTIEFQQPKIDGDGKLILELRNIRISPKAHSQCREKKVANRVAHRGFRADGQSDLM
jgi:hypothetical protein